MSVERPYHTQRICGLWLTYIGSLIVLASFWGGDLLIHPVILGVGYFVGFFAIYVLPYANQKLAFGKSTKFQDTMDTFSIVLNVLLCTACGLIIGFDDLRLFWLSIFIAVGVHFFGFYFSQGRLLIFLGILTIINGLTGLLLTTVPFIFFALMDGFLKLLFGIKLMVAKQCVHASSQNTAS